MNTTIRTIRWKVTVDKVIDILNACIPGNIPRCLIWPYLVNETRQGLACIAAKLRCTSKIEYNRISDLMKMMEHDLDHEDRRNRCIFCEAAFCDYENFENFIKQNECYLDHLIMLCYAFTTP